MLQAAQSRFHQQRTGFTAHRRHHFLLQHGHNHFGRNIVAEQLNVDAETITMKTRFDELNADSLDVVEVIMTLESEFDLQIPDEAAEPSLPVPAWS